MKFWTIQTKNVEKIICDKGIYQPMFSDSRYLKINDNLNSLYSILLHAFNKVNGTDLPGVVYAFAKKNEGKICSIETIEDFKEFIKNNQNVLDGFWKMLDKDNSVIIELNYEDDFNPIYIDINDFQFLMPPVLRLPPYTEKSISRILNDIENGKITESEFPSNVIQAHLPNIKKSNVVNIYQIFDLD